MKHHLLDRGDQLAMGIDAEAERGQRIERGALPLRPVLALDQQEIGVEVQAAIGDDAGLQRAQRSGGGVAGIDGRRQALLLALFVQAQEGGFGHHRLAAHLKCLRQAGSFFGVFRRRW
jgi:hypothetical protein